MFRLYVRDLGVCYGGVRGCGVHDLGGGVQDRGGGVRYCIRGGVRYCIRGFVVVVELIHAYVLRCADYRCAGGASEQKN